MRSIRTGRPLPRFSPRRPLTAAALGLALAASPLAAVTAAVAGTSGVEVAAAEPGTPRTPTLPAGNGGGAWWP